MDALPRAGIVPRASDGRGGVDQGSEAEGAELVTHPAVEFVLELHPGN